MSNLYLSCFSSASFSALIVMLCGKVASWEVFFLARFPSTSTQKKNPRRYGPDWGRGACCRWVSLGPSPPLDLCAKPQAKSSSSLSHKFYMESVGKHWPNSLQFGANSLLKKKKRARIFLFLWLIQWSVFIRITERWALMASSRLYQQQIHSLKGAIRWIFVIWLH